MKVISNTRAGSGRGGNGDTALPSKDRGSMLGMVISAELARAHRHDAVPRPDVPTRAVLETSGDLLRALAAPLRIAIVLQLSHSARCVHELVDALDVPQPLVSQHLRILKTSGVVAGTRSGREVLYRLVDHHLADIVLAAVTHAKEHR